MENIARISSSLSEPWTAWMMLFLLFILLLANHFQPNIIRASFMNLLSKKDRDSIFESSALDIRGQVMIHIYKLSIIALAIFLLCTTSTSFAFNDYAKVVGLVLALFVTKWLVSIFLSYIYTSMHALQSAIHAYGHLLTCVSVGLYPLLLVGLFAPEWQSVYVIGIYVIGIAFGIVACMKAMQLFALSPISIFYIVVYLATLEFLPFAGTMKLCYNIVQ